MARYQPTPIAARVLISGVMLALTLAQGKQGTVITVDDKGMATVRLEEQEQTAPAPAAKGEDRQVQTVTLPGAKVGDKVVCVVQNALGKWECTVHNL